MGKGQKGLFITIAWERKKSEGNKSMSCPAVGPTQVSDVCLYKAHLNSTSAWHAVRLNVAVLGRTNSFNLCLS